MLHGFAEYLKLDRASRARLIRAGPSVKSIDDDPEQPATMDDLIAHWRERRRSRSGVRVRLVNLPMADLAENAAMVDALQRQRRSWCKRVSEKGSA